MDPSLSSLVKLNNGVLMPRFGLGTFQANKTEVKTAVSEALQQGYRLIDSAASYGNEEAIGEALCDCLSTSTLKRQDLFITTKLMSEEKSDPQAALRNSLKKLKLDYVDLYLVHWPQSGYIKDQDCWQRVPNHKVWKTLEQCVSKGLAKSIGVSNFNCQSLLDLLTYCEIKPVVNQIELHPYLPQTNLVEFMKRVGIQPMAYSPLGAPGTQDLIPRKQKKTLLKDPLVQQLGVKYGMTEGQVLINWGIQRGHIMIPKSSNPERLQENLKSQDFKLQEEDVQNLTKLDCKFRAFDAIMLERFGKIPTFE